MGTSPSSAAKRRRLVATVLASAAFGGMGGCGEPEPDPPRLSDLPLPHGFRVIEPISTCVDESAYCSVQALVGGPTAGSRRDLLRTIKRSLLREGWDLYAQNRRALFATRGDLQVQVFTRVTWPARTDHADRPFVGMAASRALDE